MPADTDTPTAPTALDDPQASASLPSTRARRLWKVGGAVVTVILLPFGVMQAVSQLAHEQHTEVREFPADDVRVIEVHNSSGRVDVVSNDATSTTADSGGADDKITVTAHISDGLRSTGHHERIDGDRLILEATCPMFFSSFCEVSYTVETPPGVDVDVRTDQGVRVEGIDGDIAVRSDQGTVELARIGGDVRVDTDQGAVRASGLRSDDVNAQTDQGGVLLRFNEPPRRVVADSDQGSVEVVLPDDGTEYKLTTDTDQGTVHSQIDSDPRGDRSITATTDQGDVTLRYP